MADKDAGSVDKEPGSADLRNSWELEKNELRVLPQVYFNNTVVTLSASDFYIRLERNGAPVVILNASYTAAKTLSLQISELVKDLEEKAKIEIITMEDVKKAYSNE
ncbi:MAG: hypothetical protein HQK99_16075 [Nitrospirae bacterium]|nr:hypothetical protein [Nitrospirota bacterium]